MSHIEEVSGLTRGGAYSQIVRVGSVVSVAGQTGVDPHTGALVPGFEDQVRQAIVNLETVLAVADLSLRDLVKTTCYLADIGRFADFDAVYRDLVPSPWPTRATVGVDLAGDLQFEIDAWAAAPGQD
jgi:2-iminobutanoate/2-iminopropanoate deaminase